MSCINVGVHRVCGMTRKHAEQIRMRRSSRCRGTWNGRHGARRAARRWGGYLRVTRYMPICRKNKVTMPSEQCLSAGASPLQTTLDGRLKLTEQQSSAHVIFMDEK